MLKREESCISKRLDFTDQEIIQGRNVADLKEGIFKAEYIEYNFYTGIGIAYGVFDEDETETDIAFQLLEDSRKEIFERKEEVTAGEVFNAGWDFYQI